MNAPDSSLLTVGNRVPDLSLPTLDGGSVNLLDFHGRKWILFMWASW
ncbi:MAG TPA: hypothetical protein DEP84_18395 [Chloroflexi bacterium]|nr:hypothetical protein [Chloroflexota bacterium]